jgi:hypothetical protein
MVQILHLVICAAVVVVGYLIIKRRCIQCATCAQKERYGGNQTKCEEACFSNQYYDACMNYCMQDGRADYMETGNEYDVLGVGPIDDLDRGYGYDTPQNMDAQPGDSRTMGPRIPSDQRFGLRGETPGH